MAARRGGAGVGETTTAAGAQTTSPLTRECHWCYNSRRITHSQDDEGRVCSYCFDWPEVVQAREGAVARAAARAVPTISAAEAYRRLATDDRHLSNVPQPSSRPTPQPSSPQPSTPPSRFSLLEVDLPPEPTSQISRSLDTDPAALQEELRVERERNRAQAAAQMQKSRFDLLECDLPAVPVAAVPAVAVRASSPRPVVSSSPPPRPRNPVETITDLTAARSPLELARMLEGLNDELSTMMRQREAN